jgi:hypothetical protein
MIYQVTSFPKHTLFCSCFDHNPLLSFPVIANGQPPSRQVIRIPNSVMNLQQVSTVTNSYSLQTNEKSLRKWLDNELEVMAKVHQVRFQYEKQIQVCVFKNLFQSCLLSANFFLINKPL